MDHAAAPALTGTPTSPHRWLPLRVLALFGLALATAVGCGDDGPPADTGGDGAGLEADDDGSTETSVGGNEPGEGGTDGMNADPEGDDDVTDGGSGQGGQTGAAGGDTG